MKKIYKIQGMHCPSCAVVIQMDLEDAGINSKCSYNKGILEIKNDHNLNEVIEIVKKAGYTLQQ